MRSLVIRPGALGDTILTFPLLASIRDACPGTGIVLLGNRACRELAPPDIELHPFDHPAWLWLFEEEPQPADLERAEFEAAYVILNRPERVVSNLRRAGIGSVRVAASRPPEGKHIVEHLHQELGLPVPPRRPALQRLASPARTDVVWVHPGSGGSRKCIPLALMADLARKLALRTGSELAITAGEDDEFLWNQPEWDALARSPGAVLLDRRPLSELMRRLGSARLFLGNDCGVSHLAAGLGIASTVFFVSTDPRQWAPWVPGDQIRIVDWRGGLPSESGVRALMEQIAADAQ